MARLGLGLNKGGEMRLAPEEQDSLGRGPEASASPPNFLLSPGRGSLVPAPSQWKISLALGLKAGPGPDSRIPVSLLAMKVVREQPAVCACLQ